MLNLNIGAHVAVEYTSQAVRTPKKNRHYLTHSVQFLELSAIELMI